MTKKEQEKYIKELEETISQFIKPLKNNHFKNVLNAISECDQITFE